MNCLGFPFRTHPWIPSPCPTLVCARAHTHTLPAAYYDSLLAKVMVYSPEGRPDAIPKMEKALQETQVRTRTQGANPGSRC